MKNFSILRKSRIDLLGPATPVDFVPEFGLDHLLKDLDESFAESCFYPVGMVALLANNKNVEGKRGEEEEFNLVPTLALGLSAALLE